MARRRRGHQSPPPLGREEALALFAGEDPAADRAGVFLSFVMIPVEERIGEWRFAGAAASAGAAAATIDRFLRAMGLHEPGSTTPALDLLRSGVLERPDPPEDGYAYVGLPLAEIGDHRVLVYGEGGAPYDDIGLAILEVPAIEGRGDHPFVGRAAETERPDAWPDDGA
ncbi:MAG: hypothetical protein R3B09_21875 [Nannocystaceae bacterium]